MFRDSKQLTKTSYILIALLKAGDVMYRAQLRRRLSYAVYPEYRNYLAGQRLDIRLSQLARAGWIRMEYKETNKILKLTRKGELEALFQKARHLNKSGPWDGKWRMVVFDIPEHARGLRDQLRKLLSSFGFKALQASVYIYPFPLNGTAVEFLKQSGLIRYIRMAKIDSFDDDSDIRKLFRKLIRISNGR